MLVEKCTLTGKNLQLVPLETQHAFDLCHHADLDAESFQYMTGVPADFSVPVFEVLIAELLSRPQSVYFAMLYQGSAVGMTSYLDIRPSHRGLEIGSTWIGRAFRGTSVNPEAKYLMLNHAFEKLGAIRVQIKTDKRNLHSQRAIEKLGAIKEGILRQHIIMPDGYIRDTVMYSILPEEWPTVRDGLIARLGYTPV